jgi:protein disulfide-isomerase A1
LFSGHCKKLEPEYSAAAKILAEQEPPKTLAKVDATENKELAERFGIQGFPTLHWFVGGERSDYTGGRTTDTIVEWITKRTGPVSEEVDCAGLQAKIDEENLLLAWAGDLTGDLFEQFGAAAADPRIFEKFTVVHTSDASCADKIGLSKAGIGLTRRFDDSPIAYTDEPNKQKIIDWARSYSVPSLMVFSEEFIEPIFADKQPALILFTEESGQGYQDVFAQAAKDQRGSILFVTSGVNDGIQARLGEFLGIANEDMPTLRLINPQETMLKYTYEGDIQALTGDAIKDWVQEFKDGKLTPKLKSEPIPESNDEGVTVIVGESWDSIVNDPEKDVLVKYYAPWCGHCKALAPVWDQLGDDVKDIPDLVVAKFDATANEVAGLEIRGYPTLKFYPKDNKAGIDYNAGRELDDFKNWFAENSSAYKAARGGSSQEKVEDL